MAKQESIATQQFVDVVDIKDGVVILKSGAVRKILMVSGINFDIKSEEDQNIIIYAFQNFLNILDFSCQIVIHSRKMNIDGYLDNLIEKQDTEENELLKNQIYEYIEFIRSFVKQNAVMDKTFFVVVPYESVQISKVGADIVSSLKFWEKKPEKTEKEKKDEGIEQKIIQVNQRAEQVVNGLNQIGLRVVALNTEELIELFYNLYNPAAVEKKKLKIAKEQNG